MKACLKRKFAYTTHFKHFLEGSLAEVFELPLGGNPCTHDRSKSTCLLKEPIFKQKKAYIDSPNT